MELVFWLPRIRILRVDCMKYWGMSIRVIACWYLFILFILVQPLRLFGLLRHHRYWSIGRGRASLFVKLTMISWLDRAYSRWITCRNCVMPWVDPCILKIPCKFQAICTIFGKTTFMSFMLLFFPYLHQGLSEPSSLGVTFSFLLPPFCSFTLLPPTFSFSWFPPPPIFSFILTFFDGFSVVLVWLTLLF